MTNAYVFVIIAVFPLLIGSQGFSGMSATKYTAFVAITCVYLGVMLLLSLEGALIGSVKPMSPLKLVRKSSWVQRFALLYLLFTWVSAFASQYFPQTIYGGSRHQNAFVITLYVAAFLLVSVYGKADHRLLAALGFSVTLFCVVCFLQFAGLNPFWLYPDGMTYHDAGTLYVGEHIGTIGNADFAAGYLSLVIPIMWVALVRLPGRKKFLLCVPLACSLIVLAKMDIAAGYVGVLVGGILALPIVLPISERCKKLMWLTIAAGGITALVLVFFVDFGGVLHEAHEILHGNIDDSFGTGRIYIWKETLKRIPQHFWFGSGPDTMLNEALPSFTKYDAASGTTSYGLIDAAHNEYLDILFSKGIFAFLSYMAMLACAAVLWFKNSANNTTTAILGGAVLCYCVQAVFGITQCATAPLMWVALAILCQSVVQIKGGSIYVEKASKS